MPSRYATDEFALQVLKVSARDGRFSQPTITQVYANDGATVSGTSVAMRFSSTVIIGSLYSRLISCELQAPQLL